jgi:hypothetical protein
VVEATLFIPTSSAWLNIVERWFREITDNRIRRAIGKSAPDFIAPIKDYPENHNSQVFAWSAPAEQMLATMALCGEALAAPHEDQEILRLVDKCWPLPVRTAATSAIIVHITGRNHSGKKTQSE